MPRTSCNIRWRSATSAASWPPNWDSTSSTPSGAAYPMSGPPPGAGREMLETYVKRLDDLERVALSFGGISKTYAIQAGREIRLIVESEQDKDERAALRR